MNGPVWQFVKIYLLDRILLIIMSKNDTGTISGSVPEKETPEVLSKYTVEKSTAACKIITKYENHNILITPNKFENRCHIFEL